MNIASSWDIEERENMVYFVMQLQNQDQRHKNTNNGGTVNNESTRKLPPCENAQVLNGVYSRICAPLTITSI